MRTIRLDDSDSDRTWLWLAAGAVLGLAAGVLVAERFSGRKLTMRSLVGRGGKLAAQVARNWAPLLESARAVRDVWAERNQPDEDEWEEEWEEEDEEQDDATAALDDGEPDEGDDEEEEDGEDEPDDADETGALDARVLEAFAHDPVLSQRAVEIEESPAGEIVLHGRVRTAREVKHAVTIARGVPGVRRVRQRLAVRTRA